MPYDLYYWPMIQGRGEFIRLALEDAGAEYRDVAREENGMQEMQALLDDGALTHLPFAPPFLRADKTLIAQTANILFFLGPRLRLAPEGEAGRMAVNGLQLTIADAVAEAHDTHHPVASSLYYEDQKPEAKRRSADFIDTRIPKFLHYFQRVIAQNPTASGYLVGDTLTYADLSLFQLVEGLRYAFPRGVRDLEKQLPGVIELHDRVAARPRIGGYLASPRRIPFNQSGIFRHYPELDREPS